jgi:hypothetical protein
MTTRYIRLYGAFCAMLERSAQSRKRRDLDAALRQLNAAARINEWMLRCKNL